MLDPACGAIQVHRLGLVALRSLVPLLILLPSGSAVEPCPDVHAAASLGAEDLLARFFFEADSATAGAHLSAADKTAASAFQARATMTGLSDGLATLQDQPPTFAEFPARGKTSPTFFLNLSKPIVGTVYLRSEATTALQRDTFRIRAELFVDGIRAGGTERVFGTSNLNAWQAMHLCFRPEIQRINAGSEVSARIYRYNSLSNLEVGTQEPAQSYFEFAYFEADPLRGTFYLDQGVLQTGSPAAGTEAGGLFALALLGLAASLRRRGSAAALLALAVLASGCMGATPAAAPATSDSPEPTIESRSVQDPSLKANGTGAVRGTIRNHLGIPIPKAHVALLGTILFQTTGAEGTFGFDGVRPDHYQMRIDADGYVPVEETITVRLGEILFQNVTLVSARIGGANLREHVHDYWGDETRKLVSTTEFSFGNYVDQARGEIQQRGVSYCSGYLICQGKVKTAEGASILPGTGLVEVHLKWSATGPGAPREVGLRIWNPVSSWENQVFVFRKSGDPFRIAIFPNEADPGHQKFSNWIFNVQVGSQTNTVNPFGAPVYASYNLKGSMEVYVNKAVVPFEPSHRDMWGNATEIQVFKEKTITSSCSIAVVGCGDYPNPLLSWTPGPGIFIPAGTKELKGSLEWTHPAGSTVGTTWVLAYRPANVPAGSDEWKQATMTPVTPLKSTFIIPVTPEMGDQFYQTVSNWQFSPDDNEDQVKFANTGLSGVKWTLTLTAHKDPAFVDE